MLNSTPQLQRRAEPPAGQAALLEIAPLAVLAVFCGFLLFYGLASFGLVGADEPRYAQIAREMLARHDWVTPVLQGKPWLEKPILYYWQAMLSYSIFGVSDWAARLPVACDAFALILAIYFFVRRFRPGLQLDAGLIAASMAAVIGFGRAASTDMPLMSTFTIAILGWLAWHLTGQKRWLAAFFVFLGLGMLAKGPVAPFLAALLIVPFAAIRRNWSIVRKTLWIPGILLFLAVALPWYINVQARVPEFFRVFILEHNLERYGTNVYRHHQPFWYYVPVILVAVLPWTVLAITALVSAIRRLRNDVGVQKDAGAAPFSNDEGATQDIGLFAVLWAVLPIIFFSFSGSKLPGYILPAVPGFVLLVVEWLHRKRTDEKRVHPVLIVAHAAFATLVLASALLSQYIVYRLKPSAQAYSVAGFFSAVVFIVIATLLLMRGAKVLHFVTLFPVVLGLAFVIKLTAPVVDATQSARPVAAVVRSAESKPLLVAGFGIRRELEYGLAFYLNQPVSMYDRAEIPSGEHVLLVRKGEEAEMTALIPGRTVTRISEYGPQGVEIYDIGPAK
jgi:4-amino-4-deoxy-L-arabinose transferase-like glycosyltransferase